MEGDRAPQWSRKPGRKELPEMPRGTFGKTTKSKDVKGKGKWKGCPQFNSPKGCMHGLQCRNLHEGPAVAANVSDTKNEPAFKAKPKSAAEKANPAASEIPKT